MRIAAAALVLAGAALTGLHAAGAREKPGDARFDVTGRIEELRLPISAKPVTVSLWTPLAAGAGVANLGEAPVYREAARRTLRKLGAKKIGSAEMPVVFDPDAGRAILGLLSSCVNGGSIASTWARWSMMAVAPVLVARSIGRWNSSARRREICRCWATAIVSPNQPMLLRLANSVGALAGSAKRRASSSPNRSS